MKTVLASLVVPGYLGCLVSNLGYFHLADSDVKQQVGEMLNVPVYML